MFLVGFTFRQLSHRSCEYPTRDLILNGLRSSWVRLHHVIQACVDAVWVRPSLETKNPSVVGWLYTSVHFEGPGPAGRKPRWEWSSPSEPGRGPSHTCAGVCSCSVFLPSAFVTASIQISRRPPDPERHPPRISDMDRLKLVLQYFQSNSESISNGICIVLALVSVKLYTSFDFNCPCLPQYNKLYSLGVMIVPPFILFFLGVLVNRHTGVMMDEWMRPMGNRSKNPAVVKWVADVLPQGETGQSVSGRYASFVTHHNQVLLPGYKQKLA